MPTIEISGLPIDRNTVEELKEKLLGLSVENENESENDECLENGHASYDEGMDDMSESYEGSSTFPEVAFLLDGMGMKKYIKIFQKENIDLKSFLNLTEKDLEEIGVYKKKDRKIIINNLGGHKGPSADEFIVDENHTADYQIIKNVQNQLTLIVNYCSYIECEMKKKKLADYVTSSERALTFFTQFTETAVKQSKLIRKLMFQQDSSNNMIGKLLEANKLVLPEDLKQKLVTKKIKKRKHSRGHLVGIIGLSVVLIYGAKKLLKRIIN